MSVTALHRPVKEFSSAAEAIFYQRNNPRSERAMQDTAKVGGQKVKSYSISDVSIEFHLDNSQSLCVFDNPNFVEWKLQDIPDNTVDNPSVTSDYPIALFWGYDGTWKVYDPERLLSNVIGDTIVKIEAVTPFIVVWFKDNINLMLSSIQNTTTKETLLCMVNADG